jgi:hypothetical protein
MLFAFSTNGQNLTDGNFCLNVLLRNSVVGSIGADIHNMVAHCIGP